MPQFDLANASLSTAGLNKIKQAEKYIPFVYDDGYPYIAVGGLQYLDSDPKPPSAVSNFISDFYGRVPYDPSYHGQIRGTLTIGYGTTVDGTPGKDNLYKYLENSSYRRRNSTKEVLKDTKFCLNPTFKSDAVPIFIKGKLKKAIF